MGLKLKRKEAIDLLEMSTEEMFDKINEMFRCSGGFEDGVTHYILAPTTFNNPNKAYLMCDYRDCQPSAKEYDNLLPVYYGSTMRQAVLNCYKDHQTRDYTI